VFEPAAWLERGEAPGLGGPAEPLVLGKRVRLVSAAAAEGVRQVKAAFAAHPGLEWSDEYEELLGSKGTVREVSRRLFTPAPASRWSGVAEVLSVFLCCASRAVCARPC
jgi:hypothetical protein